VWSSLLNIEKLIGTLVRLVLRVVLLH
jgi:hypothetical protein